jgi:hypothetical protein
MSATRLRGARPAVAWLERHALFVAGLATVAAVLLATIPTHLGQDGWLALVAGRQVAQFGIPHHDTLAVLTHGAVWTDQQWLSQLAMYGLDRVGGLALYSIVYVLLGVGAAGFAIAAARRLGATESHVVWVLPVPAFLFFAGSFAIRTQGFAYPLFVATLWLLAAQRRTPSRRVYLVLPLLVLWANLHGSVTLGVAIACLYGLTLLGEDLRRAPRRPRARSLVFVLGPPLCLLATPYGLAGLSYYRETLFNPAFKTLVSEWAPVTAAVVFAVPFFLLAFTTVWLFGRSRGRVALFEQLTLVLLIASGISAVRNVTWFGLAAIVLLPPIVGQVAPQRPAPRRRPQLNLALAGAALLVMVASGASVAARASGWFERGYDQRTTPIVAGIARADPGVRIYADDRFGDWLLWHRSELAGRIAYDSRLELLSASQLSLVAQVSSQASPQERGLISRFGVFVLDTGNTAKVRSILALPGSRVVFRGRGVIVATRSGA